MMNELASYVAEAWVAGKGRAATLVNPATEEALATTSTEGLDFGAALAFARDRGGPALRAMTLQRSAASCCARCASAIHAHARRAHRARASRTAATRAPTRSSTSTARSGTLAAYADLAQELGDAQVLVDGDGVQLGRSARLFGQHVYVPREGVAVHVNAFNFPAWGLGEKAACALLAGMPVVAKPATSTALVAHRIVEILVDEKVLPEGALSFVCGCVGRPARSPGRTGRARLHGLERHRRRCCAAARRSPTHSAHVNVEADSLNAAVLGPDVDDGSELMNLFVGDVVRDMTQKTGQKCTAIRRVYVPAAQGRGRARAAARAARRGEGRRSFARGRRHGPGRDGAAARRRARRASHASQTCARAVCGGAGRGRRARRHDRQGLLRRARRSFTPTSSRAERRRPRSTRCSARSPPSCRTTARRRRRRARVAWGGGGLVSSVYSDDKDFVRERRPRDRAVPRSRDDRLVEDGVAGHPARHGAAAARSTAAPVAPAAARSSAAVAGSPSTCSASPLQGDRALVEAIAGKR